MLRHKWIAFFIGFFLLLGLACRSFSSPPETTPTGEASITTQPSGAITIVQGQDVSVPIQGLSGEIQNPPQDSGPQVQPTVGPISAFQPLIVESQRIGDKSLILTIENPNPDLAVKNTQYQVIGYGSSGAVLESSTVDLGYLFPGERRYQVVGLFLAEGVVPDKMEIVSVREGEAEPTQIRGSIFSTLSAMHYEHENKVTGIIQNNAEMSVIQPRLTVLAYDENDQVVAAASDLFSGFIPGHGQAAVEMGLYNVQAKRVELYASPQGDWTMEQDLTGYQSLQVDSPFGIYDPTGMAKVLFFVTNPNSDRSLQLSEYQVAAYAAGGSVLGAATGLVPLVFPGERIAVISTGFYVPEDIELSRVDAQIMPVVEEFDLLNHQVMGLAQNPVTATDAEYAGQFVNCTVQSSWKNEINLAVVVAVLYDANDNIIGVGSSSGGPLPANGQIDMQIYIDTAADFVGAPAHIELYPAVSNPTDIR